MGASEIPPAGNDATHMGIVYGGANDGEVYSDNGKMSVVGWDTVKSDISTQGGRITTIEGNYATKLSTTPGTYAKVIVNGEGLVSSGSGLSSTDIPEISL
jgi:hypothetical protein